MVFLRGSARERGIHPDGDAVVRAGNELHLEHDGALDTAARQFVGLHVTLMIGFRARGAQVHVAGDFIVLAGLRGVERAVSPGFGRIADAEPFGVVFKKLKAGEIFLHADVGERVNMEFEIERAAGGVVAPGCAVENVFAGAGFLRERCTGVAPENFRVGRKA